MRSEKKVPGAHAAERGVESVALGERFSTIAFSRSMLEVVLTLLERRQPSTGLPPICTAALSALAPRIGG